jgi:hypothetical protein
VAGTKLHGHRLGAPNLANRPSTTYDRTPEEGWWVDIEHPDSIGAIEKSLTDLLKTQKIAQLDTSHLRSPNRHLTTAIAQWTREQVLFDGSEALGVIFGSRHGEYLNWAGWLRRKDQNQGTDNYRQVQSNRIPFNHSALLRVANRYGLKIF